MAVRRVQCWFVAAILGWCAVAARVSPAADPPRLVGESRRTLQRFAEAADLEKQRRWTDAIELYLRVLDEAGDDIVPADSDTRHYLPARALIHRRLAARPELLPPYRERVEARAQRLFEQGEAQHDPQPLEQLIDNFFCSRTAEAALHMLGDLACEHGDFEHARYYWRLLEPAATAHNLAYPDPKGDVALPRAKQVLARLLAGQRDEAAVALQAFRAIHPNATGHLAGRDGNFAATLKQLLDTPDIVRVPSLSGLAPTPTTFGVDATRNGVLTGLLPPFSPQPRYPPIPLPGAGPTANDYRFVQRPLIRAPALAFHPVIALGQVFVADASRVTSYDLATGKLSGQFDVTRSDPRLASLRDLRLPSTSDARYTVTTAGDRIFARLGQPKMRADRGESASYLVCLQWQPGGAAPDERLRLRWLLPSMKADAESGPVTHFEGTPIVREGRLYVAVTRLDANRAITALACYDAADPTAAGPLWQHDVYETAADTAERTRQHLVTLAGPHVIYCSHAGVVVALEATTGRRAWAVRYPTRGPRTANGEPSPRDLSPCVAAGGRLYVAPADSDRIHCLDAANGAPLWQSDATEVSHLLGVVHGRVVCTIGGFLSGLCALDAATGRRIADWGYRVSGADALTPFGRGLLCGDRIYWPTRGAGVKELRWDGTVVYAPAAFQALPGGNLAYGDGCLVVATADRLHVLVGAAIEATGPVGLMGRQPQDATSQFRAGLALADAGQASPALERLRAAERDAELHDQARRYRHELLLWQAERLRLSGRPTAEVRSAFVAAAAPEFDLERRLSARVRSAGKTGGEPKGRALVDAAGLIVPPPRAPMAARQAVRGRGTPVSSWQPPLELGWTVPLEPGESVLVPDGRPVTVTVAAGISTSPVIHDSLIGRAGMILTAEGTRLRSRAVPSGDINWERSIAFVPTWLAIDAEGVIVAGGGGVGRYARRDGRPIWSWSAPVSAPWLHATSGWRDPDAVAPQEELADFHWAGGRVFARLGERSFVALDGTTGALLWQRLAPVAGRFFAHYHADESAVVAQTSDGQRWGLAAANGRTLYAAPASSEPWPEAPLALGDGLLLVAEDERVAAFGAQSGDQKWGFPLPRWPSLMGLLPRVKRSGGSVIVGMSRNDCFEVVRLDRANGLTLSEPVVVSPVPIDLSAVAVDDVGWHLAEGRTLRTLADGGRVVEKRELPAAPEYPLASHWRIEQPHPDWWLLWTVPQVSATEPAMREGRMVLLPRQSKGAKGETLTFEHFGPRGGVWPVRDGVVVVTAEDVRFYRAVEQGAK